MTYMIQRIYLDANYRRHTLKKGLTLEQAQAYCSHPDTSSSTCTTSAGKHRTRKRGPWFDSYTTED